MTQGLYAAPNPHVRLPFQKDSAQIWPHEGHLSTEVNPANEIAEWCYAYAHQAINQARPILRQLAERYPMVLVSNFYGNIESVLHDFELDNLFGSIVESAVVGVRKPNPAIFQMGVDRPCDRNHHAKPIWSASHHDSNI